MHWPLAAAPAAHCTLNLFARRPNGLVGGWQAVFACLDRAKTVSYTHLDAADEEDSVDLGGRRII